MRLFSYCLRYDDGAAPNPFWGVCTLTICKPRIRLAAQVGDWIVGLGSAHSPIGNIADCVVYAMQVTTKLTISAYDDYCRSQLPSKIPCQHSQDIRRRMGDCIYDYAQGEPPRLRASVHGEGNRARDLRGRYALLSTHFYYFGNQPMQLPDELLPIIHSQQGHKSYKNQAYLIPFVTWVKSFGYQPNVLLGQPQFRVVNHQDAAEHTCAPGTCDDTMDSGSQSIAHCGEPPHQEHSGCHAHTTPQQAGASHDAGCAPPPPVAVPIARGLTRAC